MDVSVISSHIKDQVKEVYLDTSAMDDEQLLMQFFKKRDADNNMKLDGLELLRALVEMEGERERTLLLIIIIPTSRGRTPPSRRDGAETRGRLYKSRGLRHYRGYYPLR